MRDERPTSLLVVPRPATWDMPDLRRAPTLTDHVLDAACEEIVALEARLAEAQQDAQTYREMAREAIHMLSEALAHCARQGKTIQSLRRQVHDLRHLPPPADLADEGALTFTTEQEPFDGALRDRHPVEDRPAPDGREPAESARQLPTAG